MNTLKEKQSVKTLGRELLKRVAIAKCLENENREVKSEKYIDLQIKKLIS